MRTELIESAVLGVVVLSFAVPVMQTFPLLGLVMLLLGAWWVIRWIGWEVLQLVRALKRK